MRRTPVLLASIVALLALQMISLVWGVTYNWPDFLHVNYGLPLVWATHTLDILTGPVDIWRVDIDKLLIDMLFWDGLLIIMVAVLNLKMKN